MQLRERLAQRIDRIDDRFRWARFDPAGLVAVGQPAHPLPEPETVATDRLQWSHDPAKGGKADDKSVQEAAVAVMAEHLGVLSGMQREPSGHSEFLDDRGRPWDVKSPVSPDREGWNFDPHHHLEVIREDLDQGEGILLDLSRLHTQDSRSLVAVLQDGLEVHQHGQVLVLLEQDLVG